MELLTVAEKEESNLKSLFMAFVNLRRGIDTVTHFVPVKVTDVCPTNGVIHEFYTHQENGN